MSKDIVKNQCKNEKAYPHVFVILGIMIVLSTIATYLIPSGEYEMVIDEVTGRSLMISDSFKYIRSSPVGVLDMFISIIEGMRQGSQTIFFILIVGASIHLVGETGAIDAAIASMANITEEKPQLSNIFIALSMILVSFWASTGTLSFAEMIVFIPIFVSLSIALGYDTIVGLAMSLLAVGVGYSSSTINPFTVGVAQDVAELPLGSGMGFRFIVLAVTTSITVIYVLIYANKIKKDPSKSLVADIEMEDLALSEERLETKFTRSRALALISLFSGILSIVIGIYKYDWYISEFSAVFLIIAILSGIFNRFNANKIADNFAKGIQKSAMPAMVIGMARGVVVILNKGNILDTIVHAFVSVLGNLSIYTSSILMLLFQTLLNFIIPSGSGQAATTMPIMTPIGDLIGLNRQIAVLIFQFGDGLSNLMWPTGIVLIFCSIARIPVTRYYKFLLPLFFVLLIVQITFIFIAINIGYGPF